MSASYETTTVYSTVCPVDDPHVFVDCRWTVKDGGCLHIFRASSDGRETVMVAAFGAGSWFLVHADAQVSP